MLKLAVQKWDISWKFQKRKTLTWNKVSTANYNTGKRMYKSRCDVTCHDVNYDVIKSLDFELLKYTLSITKPQRLLSCKICYFNWQKNFLLLLFFILLLWRQKHQTRTNMSQSCLLFRTHFTRFENKLQNLCIH